MKSDKDLQHDIMEDFRWDPSIDASKIGVATSDGVVTLTGAVPSYFQKQNGVLVAERVAGVRAVANDIEVQLPSAVQKTDTGIATTALNALKWSASVPDENIKVFVSKGWLTLEGNVEWNYQREAAEKAVEGVLTLQFALIVMT